MTAGSVESKPAPSKVDPSERMNDRIPLEIATRGWLEGPHLDDIQALRSDNARGQTIPYDRTEIAGSALTTEISAVKGDRIELRITGSTHAIAKGPWLMGDNYWKPAAPSLFAFPDFDGLTSPSSSAASSIAFANASRLRRRGFAITSPVELIATKVGKPRPPTLRSIPSFLRPGMRVVMCRNITWFLLNFANPSVENRPFSIALHGGQGA
jgi:hypothetical protein